VKLTSHNSVHFLDIIGFPGVWTDPNTLISKIKLTGCGCSNSNHHISKTNDNHIMHNQQLEGFMRIKSP